MENPPLVQIKSGKLLANLAIWLLASVLGCYFFYFSPFNPKPNNAHGFYSGQKPAQTTSQPKMPLETKKPAHVITVPILMYHHVGDLPKNASPMRKDLTVAKNDFTKQVQWLYDNGYTSISLQNILDFSKGSFIMPEKPVVFTFDDGYQDVFKNAVPVLEQHGYKGSFAIITGYPGNKLGDNFYASWDDILGALHNGHEIVSHTQHHFDGTAPGYSQSYILKNLSSSINDLQNHLGINTQILVYPYGHYNPSYIKQAKKAGFVMGVTVREGDSINLKNLMEVPRVRVHGTETLERFKNIILHQVQHTATSR